MNYSLHFLPEVENDVLSGFAWYESKSPGLGREFLRIFYALASEIPRNPFLYQKVYGDIRRRLLRRFPYCIYFLIEEKEVIITGLFHCARNPRTIRKSLSQRGDD